MLTEEPLPILLCSKMPLCVICSLSFVLQVAIHQALLQSLARTLIADQADFYFIPVYTACNFNTENGFPNLSRAPDLLRAAIERIAAEHPFWNRSKGRDHVLVASHDFGACFHAMVGILQHCSFDSCLYMMFEKQLVYSVCLVRAI